MAQCLIGLGANLGDKSANLAAAVDQLGSNSGIEVQAVSSTHQTSPVGGPAGQDLFANAAALIETELSAQQVIELLLETELQFGRHRDVRWQARTLDMDLLLHEHEVLATEKHIVPHPRMSFRRFVLAPCCEIAPDFRHLILNMSIAELLAAINADEKIIVIASTDEIAAKSLIDAVADAAASYDKTLVIDLARSRVSGSIALAVAMMDCPENIVPDQLHRDARSLLIGVRSPMLVVDRNDINSAQTELIAALEAIQ